jgi:putative oxidoreductase
MERVNDTFLLVGRLLMASLFLSAGLPKALGGYEGFAKYIGGLGVPYPDIVAMVAVAVEVLGPIALILGLFPRLTALLLIAFVVIATGLAHRFWEFPEAQQMAQRNNFLKNVAIIGGLLFYYAAGAGAWAMSGRGERAGAGLHARA